MDLVTPVGVEALCFWRSSSPTDSASPKNDSQKTRVVPVSSENASSSSSPLFYNLTASPLCRPFPSWSSSSSSSLSINHSSASIHSSSTPPSASSSSTTVTWRMDAY